MTVSEIEDIVYKIAEKLMEDVKTEFYDEIRRLEIEIENLRSELTG